MIKNILVYTIIPVLVAIIIIFTWANSKINQLKSQYENRFEIPLRELEKLNEIGMKLYQFSTTLLNDENKKVALEKAIEILETDKKLIQTYQKLIKESKTLEKLNSAIDNNISIAKAFQEKLSKASSKK
jgi:hypothetical protein